jgi:hypothetical protein
MIRRNHARPNRQDAAKRRVIGRRLVIAKLGHNPFFGVINVEEIINKMMPDARRHKPRNAVLHEFLNHHLHPALGSRS